MTFEELLARSRSLRLPETDRQRYVDWLGIHRVVGFSLQPEGGVEIFLRGERLAAVSPLVRRHMQYDTWEGSEATFTATRLVLPPDAHFRSIGAFIAEELFRHGFETTPVTAFAAAEPIIEIAQLRNEKGHGQTATEKELRPFSKTEVLKHYDFFKSLINDYSNPK
jgi:hypothetical protein